jgi:hypothetical protein
VAAEGVAVGPGAVPRYCGLECAGPYSTVKWGNLGPIPYVFSFYVAAWAAIPAIIAAELAAYTARRRRHGQLQALSSTSSEAR